MEGKGLARDGGRARGGGGGLGPNLGGKGRGRRRRRRAVIHWHEWANEYRVIKYRNFN